MSVELIALVISTVTLMLGFVGAFGWMVHRIDSRIDGPDSRLTDRIDGVERGLVGVKIAIARLEGPPPRLVTAR